MPRLWIQRSPSSTASENDIPELTQFIHQYFLPDEPINRNIKTADGEGWIDCYIRNIVDDTFIIWQHGPQHLQSFLDYLNDLHPSIKFTMEQEGGNSISFLDVKVHRHADGSLGHSVYRKPTHTDRYLHNSSFHHPSVKSSVTRTLVQRAHKICDQEHLQDELQHISTALHLNGYHRPQVKTKHPDCRVPYTQSQTQNYKATVNLPYLGNSSHKIQRILNQANIKSIPLIDQETPSQPADPQGQARPQHQSRRI